MTLINIHLPPPKPNATMDEIKQWIKSIDTDKDGKISKQELQVALAHLGKWFAVFKGQWAMWMNDLNANGYIDTADEFKELENYAQKHWGHKIALVAPAVM